MAQRFYEFHFAEMDGMNVKNLGMLSLHTAKKITKDYLKDFARKYLNNPDANIRISYVAKLKKAEFEEIARKKHANGSV